MRQAAPSGGEPGLGGALCVRAGDQREVGGAGAPAPRQRGEAAVERAAQLVRLPMLAAVVAAAGATAGARALGA